MKSNVSFIQGNNFSGRSRLLEKIYKENKESSMFIKEIPENNLTGIFPTVNEEIKLHAGDVEKNVVYTKVINFLYSCGFEKLLLQNPLSLSGGEQTLLAIACNILLRPEKLLIDTTIEQLNESWYNPLFNFILSNPEILNEVIISDNRYKDYNPNSFIEISPDNENVDYEYSFCLPTLAIDKINPVTFSSITLNNLSFKYPNTDVFKTLNYKFETSQIYHLKGKNGAGKSTLAKLLVGVLKSPKNSILFNEKSYNPYDYPGQLFGYSFQNPDEQLFSSTIENEILPIKKNEPKEYGLRREQYLKMFGLEYIRKQHPADMPFVIRKRISLAATLAMDRPFYIFDEPTLGQDDNFVGFLISLFNSLIQNGKGVIIISHNKHFIKNLNLKVLSL